MARLQRIGPLGIAQHIIQRGNNRQVCFTSNQHMVVYARWLRETGSEKRYQWTSYPSRLTDTGIR